MYAKVIVDITHEKLDRVFEYGIPKEMEADVRVGVEVTVPFGKGNRPTSGYVIGISEKCEYDPEKVKEILGLSEKKMAIEGKLVALAVWMKEQYGGTLIQSLKTVLPIKKEEKQQVKRCVRLLLSKEQAEEKLEEYLQKKNQKARARVLAALMDCPVLDYHFVLKELHVSRSVLLALEEQGVANIESEHVFRNPIKEQKLLPKEMVYTEEQQEAIDRFREDDLKKERNVYLLYGITGSGKTEVYMEMIKRVVASKRQAIVLIPEIALTYQTVLRFYQCFGERISILNSRMSNGERYDQMMRAKEGLIDVMIGPRSALFTPFPNLGLIVIDEEHEGSYKSEQTPRYHARETAIERARLEDASVVLGSATPSLESFYRAQKGEYVQLTLTQRAKRQELPTVEIVDLREELKSGNRSIISKTLNDEMEERLQKKEQMMLFMNRRGYSGFVSCRSCGYVAKCPHCDVSMTIHKGGKLICHYCGYEEHFLEQCPSCGSPYIGGFKSGTQKIEEQIRKEFPDAKVLRMDLDTTKGKHGHEEILERFANGEADILVGTQMIVKGHDFPNVTLVGVLAADISLYAEDHRAAERTFQLLVQAAGRAGRGNEKGHVVIQTYSPDHYAIQSAAKQDYESFYQKEIQYRALMGYPPVDHMMVFCVGGMDEALVETACEYVKQYAQRVNQEQITIIGPTSPHVGKLKDVYRKVLYFKHGNYACLTRMKDRLEQYIEVNSGFQTLRVQFDFDPMSSF